MYIYVCRYKDYGTHKQVAVFTPHLPKMVLSYVVRILGIMLFIIILCTYNWMTMVHWNINVNYTYVRTYVCDSLNDANFIKLFQIKYTCTHSMMICTYVFPSSIAI